VAAAADAPLRSAAPALRPDAHLIGLCALRGWAMGVVSQPHFPDAHLIGHCAPRGQADASRARRPFGVSIGAQLTGWLLAAAAHAALLWAVLDARAARATPEPPRPVVLSLVPAAERRPAAAPMPLLSAPAPIPPPRPLPPLPQFEVQAAGAAVAAVPTAPAVPAVEAAPAMAMAAPAATPPAASAAPPIRTVRADALGFAVAPVLRYPTLSRRLGEEGRVLLRVRIDAGGVPVELAVVDSSGHARLDEAALDAARRARLRPLIDGGEPRSAWVLLPFVFTLENS
jgi:protein TonB